MAEPTIFARASAQGRAGVAVVRISGPQAAACIEALTGRPPAGDRRAVLRRLRNPESGEALDDALVLYMPGPGSFTGEDVAELHVHGGPAIVASVLEALAGMEQCRMAEPGEFTRRALMNGRMDLTQVEGLADLLAADTQAQQAQALAQMEGRLRALYEDWAARLLRLGAHLEAAIDFADEELPEDLDETVRAGVMDLVAEIRAHLADGRRGERLRDGVKIAILGAPNVGKSTLINALAQRDVAIVSEEAGTTRDVLEVHLNLSGLPVTVADTAGLREKDAGTIEREGMRRALERAAQADLKLVMVEASEWPDVSRETKGLLDGTSVLLVNKVDQLNKSPAKEGSDTIFLSARDGQGMDKFLETLTERVRGLLSAGGGEEAPLTRARHREALEACLAALEDFLKGREVSVDMAAEDLRHAMHELGRLTGRVNVEDYLEVIFRDFCVGK